MSNFNQTQALAAISARYTAEMRLDDERTNTEIQESLGPRIDPNSYDQRIARAKGQQAAIMDQIEMLQSEPESELRTARLQTAGDRLAELLAEQGMHTDAAAMVSDEAHSDMYLQMDEAIQRDDAETCDCRDDKAVDRVKNAEVTIPAKSFVLEIPSIKHSGNVTLERCTKCGFSNAR